MGCRGAKSGSSVEESTDLDKKSTALSAKSACSVPKLADTSPVSPDTYPEAAYSLSELIHFASKFAAGTLGRMGARVPPVPAPVPEAAPVRPQFGAGSDQCFVEWRRGNQRDRCDGRENECSARPQFTVEVD